MSIYVSVQAQSRSILNSEALSRSWDPVLASVLLCVSISS